MNKTTDTWRKKKKKKKVENKKFKNQWADVIVSDEELTRNSISLHFLGQ